MVSPHEHEHEHLGHQEERFEGYLEPADPAVIRPSADQQLYWQKVVGGLAKMTSLSPTSNIPLCRSLDYLIRHVRLTNGALKAEDLYSGLRRYNPAERGLHTITQEQFDGHLRAWAALHGLTYIERFTPHHHVSSLFGVQYRAEPLTDKEAETYREGLAVTAR